MEPKTIVVGLDGSDLSWKALDRVIAAAKCGPVEIIVVSVAEMLSTVSMMDGCGELYQRYMDAAEAIMERARHRLASVGLQFQAITEAGRPALVLVDVARRVSADEIVVGSVGKHAVERLLVGSVSARLIETSPCTVVVVK